MLITNLIGTSTHGHINRVIDYVNDFSDVVCYTDYATNSNAAEYAYEMGVSAVKITRKMPQMRFVYEIAWEHVCRAGASENDWILSVTTDELLHGIGDLKSILSYEPLPILIPICGLYDNIKNMIKSVYEPRLFPFRYGGAAFWQETIWPDYVSVMTRRRRRMHDNLILQITSIDTINEYEGFECDFYAQ